MLTMAWRNDERSLRWFKSAAPLQWESHLGWFTRYAQRDSPDCMFFAVTRSGVPVGQTSIYNFSTDGTRAEVGRFLSDPDLRGRGLFREALLLTLDIAFGVAGLREVFLEVFKDNERAIRLYRSVGFEQTGADADGATIRMELTGAHYAAARGVELNEGQE